MNTPLLSVIVPVYKVEDYFEDCVDGAFLGWFIELIKSKLFVDIDIQIEYPLAAFGSILTQ